MAIQNGHSPHPHSVNGNRSAAAHNGNGNGRSSLPVNWERLARATAHPLRVSILEILGIDGGRVLSPYHVTELAKAGLIELVRERQVRGATEHFYRLPEATTAHGTTQESEAAEGKRAWAMT